MSEPDNDIARDAVGGVADEVFNKVANEVADEVVSEAANEVAGEADGEPSEVVDELAELRKAGRVIVTEYGYFPKSREWQESPGIKMLKGMLADQEEAFAARLSYFVAEMADFFKGIPTEEAAPEWPYWDNGWIAPLDLISLAGLVYQNRPKTYLEVGSGISTKIVRRAVEHFRLPTRIISLDPQPRSEIDALCDETIRAPLEDADLAPFAALEAGDVLFVDNSHRSFPNSDVTVFFSEILPRIKPGVFWSLHDIFLPYDYPDAWNVQNGRYYNEQYMLLAYLLGGAVCDLPVLPNAYLFRSPIVECLAVLREIPFLKDHLFGGGCFWMKREWAFGSGIPQGFFSRFGRFGRYLRPLFSKPYY